MDGGGQNRHQFCRKQRRPLLSYVRMNLSRRSFVAALAVAGACSKKQRAIVVGSKNTTEQTLLGEIISQHLERRLGRPVERRLGMPGTQLAHDTLVGHGVDLYPEYTAAAYSAVLREDPSKDQAIMLERLRQEYRRSYLCEWMDPLGIDAAYVVAARKDVAEARKLQTLSDAAASKEGFRMASSIEFQERIDGLPALSAYRIPFKSAPKTLDSEKLYKQFVDEALDMIAVNSTDGRLQKVNHILLRDDKNVFRPQLACIAVRQDALAEEPALQKSLTELTGKFNNGQIRDWNYQIDVMRRPVAEVAKEFLRILP